MSESYDNSKIQNRQQAQDWQEVYAQVKAEILFEGAQDLGNGLYRVEIFMTTSGDLVMTAQHTERVNESFVIEIRGEDKVTNLIHKEFQGDFEQMAAA